MQVPGKRNLKTAISIAICIVTAQIMTVLTGMEVGYLFSGIAVVVTMQSSMDISINKGKHRVLGTLFSGVITIVSYSIYINFIPVAFESVFVFVTIVLVIYLLNQMKIKEGILVACVVILSTYGLKETQYVQYVIIRTLETSYGVAVALLINRYLWPYKILAAKK